MDTTPLAANVGGQISLGYKYQGDSITTGAMIKTYKENSSDGHYGSGLYIFVRNNGEELNVKFNLNPSGSLTVKGDLVAYGSPSDLRLKTIKEKIQNPLAILDKISGYRFDWKEEDLVLKIKEDVGVIAQEIKEVLPELVRVNENGYYSVRDKGLTAVLIEAVKELAEKNKKLEQKNEEFETLLNSLINKQK